MKRIFFITLGDDAVQAHTSNLALFSYYCDAYLLITARITNSGMIANFNYTTATSRARTCLI